jgi:hypothetical protein
VWSRNISSDRDIGPDPVNSGFAVGVAALFGERVQSALFAIVYSFGLKVNCSCFDQPPDGGGRISSVALAMTLPSAYFFRNP